MSQVCIYFAGLGIAYQKRKGRETRWRVLFPFDTCHSLKFSYRRGGEDVVFYGHLAKSDTKVEIKTTAPVVEPTSTDNFDQFVLDLTDPDLAHRAVTRTDQWAQHGVLLTMDNAYFSVVKYLQEFPQVDGLNVLLFRTDVQEEPEFQDLLAHTVSAKIDLGDDHSLEVLIDGDKVLSVDAGQTCALIFDNDCDDKTPARRGALETEESASDMQLYYDLFTDADEPEKRFEISGTDKQDGDPPLQQKPADHRDEACLLSKDERHILTGEPNLKAYKPCMFVKMSNPGNLP